MNESILNKNNTKFCYKCKRKLYIENFNFNHKAKDKLDPRCKLCAKAYYDSNRNVILKQKAVYYEKNSKDILSQKKVYYIKNKDNIKKYRESSWNISRNSQLKHCYGITLDDYENMIDAQNYRCKICKIEQCNLNKPLVVDHNHVTGKVRGLLCDNCNVGLGRFKDKVSILKQSIEYLEEND